MIDYEFKAKVISTGICKKIKVVDNADYIQYRDGIIDDDANALFTDLVMKYGIKYIREARKINQASFKRVQRLRDRIARYLGLGQCVFCTLTFTDDVLKETSFMTRRKYVSRFLKSQSDYYVANVDYGVDDRYTHREHYHALIVKERVDGSGWIYGFTWFEKIHKYDDKILARYISKLCNHAIKDSTKRNVYIYSRS